MELKNAEYDSEPEIIFKEYKTNPNAGCTGRFGALDSGSNGPRFEPWVIVLWS